MSATPRSGTSLPSPARAVRVDAICVRFEAAWAAGQEPRIEDYLAEGQEQDRPSLLRELLALELEYRRRGGPGPALEAYLALFPADTTLIAAVFAEETPPGNPIAGGGRSTDRAAAGPHSFDAHRTTPEAPCGGLDGAPSPEGSGLPAVSGHEMLGIIGRGGMGIVYKARHRALNRLVALKMILTGAHAADDERERFRAEAEAVARLHHPGIVQIYEVGEHNGLPYLSLEYCPGGSLAARLRGAGPLTPREAASVVAQLARAVQAAHEQQVIHRDLKPANVLLREGPDVPLGDCQVKVTDFGLAKRLDASVRTVPGQVVGTPSYMAPEQAFGTGQPVGPAADVYSLGVILYECLTGGPPFRGETPGLLLQVIADDPVPPRQLRAGCPRDLETVCLKCLQKRPGHRYTTAALLAADLERYLDGRPVLAHPAGPLERLLKWARRSPAQAAALAAGVAFLLTLTGLLLGQLRAAQQEAGLQLRRAGLQTRFTALYSDAEMRAAQAAPDWAAVERDVRAAQELMDAEPAFADFPLREPARRLLERAEREKADAREQAGFRERLASLEANDGDAVFFGTLSSGLDLSESSARARQAVAAGLALFGVTADNDGPPVAPPQFYSPDQVNRITESCYELLLIDAEVLARSRPGEKVADLQGRLREALHRLDRADRLRPGLRTRSGLVRRADYLDGLRENAAAKQARQAAGETAPTLAVDYFLLGMDRCGRDEFKEAIPALTAALQLQPEHFGAGYLLSVCRLQERQFTEAKVGLSRCLKQRPDFLWPQLLLGYAEMELGEFDAAAADFAAVLDHPPDTAAAYVALVDRGVLAIRRNHWNDAGADLRRAIALQPDAVAAYINLALVYRKLAEAEVPPLQTCALSLAPQSGFCLLALEAHRRRLLAEAVAVLQEAIQRRPLEPRLYHELGQLSKLLDDPDTALTHFARAVALAPNAGAATTLADDLLEVGRLLYRRGKYAEAVRAYDGVLTVRPGQTLAHRFRAESLLKLGRYAEAGAALDRYLATVPVAAGQPPDAANAREWSQAFMARGLIHAEQNDFRAAIDSYTLGLRLQRDPETLTQRGWAYLQLGGSPLALADFEETLRLRPGSSDALLGRADVQVKQGKVREALADAREGLQHAPATSRMAYLAARVYARAAPAFLDPPAGTRPSLNDGAACVKRAGELLRLALLREPAEGRADFWRNYIRRDKAFNAPCLDPAMRTIEEEFFSRDR